MHREGGNGLHFDEWKHLKRLNIEYCVEDDSLFPPVLHHLTTDREKLLSACPNLQINVLPDSKDKGSEENAGGEDDKSDMDDDERGIRRKRAAYD